MRIREVSFVKSCSSGEKIPVVTAETLIDMSCGIESAGPVSGVPGRPSRSEQVTRDFFFNILIVANLS